MEVPMGVVKCMNAGRRQFGTGGVVKCATRTTTRELVDHFLVPMMLAKSHDMTHPLGLIGDSVHFFCLRWGRVEGPA